MAPKNWQDYEKYLKEQLCWDDGTPTHASSMLQRQCPKCRHKWSYRQQQIRWTLVLSYCEGSSALEASRQRRTAYSTAWELFSDLDKKIPNFLQQRLLKAVLNDPDKYIQQLESGGFATIERLLARKRHSKKANRLLLLRLSMEQRLEVVFRALCDSGINQV